MKKILFLATYGDFLATFELSNIKILQNMGYEVHCASDFATKEYNLKTNCLNEIGVIKHQINFLRIPLNVRNIISYNKLIALIKKEKFEVIDCHNAVIGAYARIAATQCRVKKVIYTPHSFFFYKGCSYKNILIYKRVESLFARKTDLLVAINKEDYKAAAKMKLRGKVIYVPGVGIDTAVIKALPIEREKYCNEFSIPVDAHIYISVGELIRRKNHIAAIKAFAKAKLEKSYYIIAGIGELTKELEEVIESLGMENKIKILGYRLDVKELMRASDVYLFPSFQEGLPVALMEAMACGLPCIVSEIRGNVDLIDEGKGGELFKPTDVDRLSRLIVEIDKDPDKRARMGKYNQYKISEFDIRNVQNIMIREYSNLIKLI